MKFCYTDESGAKAEDAVNVMAGVCVDATKVSKYKKEFIGLKEDIFEIYKAENVRCPTEIKTSQIYKGKNGWERIAPDKRKVFLEKSLDLLTEMSAKVFLAVIEFEKYKRCNHSMKSSLSGDWQWMAAHMALQLQSEYFGKGNKYRTLLIFDDHYGDIRAIYKYLYEQPSSSDFYDYKIPRTNKVIKSDEIMNQLMDILAVDSKSSELNQLADIVSYISRRYIELRAGIPELYSGDGQYIRTMYQKIKSQIICREKFYSEAGDFFGEIAPDRIRDILMK